MRGFPPLKRVSFVQALPEGIREVTLAEIFSLLLLVARPVKAKNVSDARIPPIYRWGVSKYLPHFTEKR